MQKIGIILLAVIFNVQLYAQKHELRLNLEEGKEYTQVTNTRSVISQSVMGQEMTITTTVTGKMVYKVLNAAANYYDMQVHYDAMTMDMEMPMMGKISYDSSSADENDIMSAFLAGMINKPFSMRMSNTGKVLQVEGMEDLFSHVLNNETLPETQRTEIKSQLSQSFGEGGIMAAIEALTAVFPEESVRVGESWSKHTLLETIMKLDINSNFTLAEKTSDYYIIKGNSVVQSADKDTPIMTQGMAMFFDLGGNMVSEMKIDAHSGWILQATQSQEITGHAFMDPNEQMPEGLSIPMHILTQTTITTE